MKNILLLALFLTMLFLGVMSAEAATRYVRQGASGANNGTDWTNAYTTLTGATLSRGDIIFVADGTYAGRTFSTAPSGTTLITICKATIATVGSCATAHGTETGWDNTYGDGVATMSSGLTFSSGYWIFDGVTGGGPGSWTTGYGFKIAHNSGPGGWFQGTNVTFRHVEVKGNGGDGAGSSPNNDSLAWTEAGDNTRVSYVYLYDAGRTLFFSNAAAINVLVEYVYGGRHESHPSEHSEIASIWGGSANWTFRYSIFTHMEGTGGLMYDSSGSAGGFYVYGNVFYKGSGAVWDLGNGWVGGWTGFPVTGMKVFNNDFVVIGSGGFPNNAQVFGLSTTGSSIEIRNNLFYSVPNVGSLAGATVSHGHYISTTSTGSNASTSSGVPFVNHAGLNFRLLAATTAGYDVGAPYNVDMYGTVRGADGVWDQGAIEFGTGGGTTVDVTPPNAPTNLTVQ